MNFKTASLVLLLGGLLSCGDPMVGDMDAYATAMAPLMTQNSTIANKFLTLAKAVHKDKNDAGAIVDRIEKEVIPVADKLRDSIAAVRCPNESLAQIHGQAVAGWTLQAEAYHELVDAYRKDDVTGFTTAQKKLGEAKVTSETYVREINRVMEPYGHHLDEFPSAQ